MTEITKYQCDICKSTFNSASEAEECEKRHCSLDCVETVYMRKQPYPRFINVTFSNGNTERYVLED